MTDERNSFERSQDFLRKQYAQDKPAEPTLTIDQLDAIRDRIVARSTTGRPDEPPTLADAFDQMEAAGSAGGAYIAAGAITDLYGRDRDALLKALRERCLP